MKAEIELLLQKLHPYRATVEETMENYDLTPKGKRDALIEINQMGCPFFARNVYMRTHHVCAKMVAAATTGP